MIKVIAFDWGGVLCSGGDKFKSKRFESSGLNYYEIRSITNELDELYMVGKIKSDDFWAEIIKKLGISNSTTKEELKEDYFNSYELYPNVLKLTKELRSNYKVISISNLNEDMVSHISKEHGVSEIFDETFFSNEVGFKKPSLEIYKLVLKKLNILPKEMVFIDDIKDNTESAKSLGIKAILFKDKDSLVEELKRLNVVF